MELLSDDIHVHSNEGVDCGTADSKEAESGSQEAQFHYEVWFPGSTSTTLTTKERLTIRDRLQKLYDHTDADQAHLKCKFMEIDAVTGKPELDPYEPVSKQINEDQSSTRVDAVPEIISQCRNAGAHRERVESDYKTEDTNIKRGMISLQKWKEAVTQRRSKELNNANGLNQ